MEASLPASCNIPSTKQVFVAQETLDHPFDVTLVVEDGKAFKAHKCVLSAASPFFQKLFNIDMRESNEGVVRLEMITELGLRDLLEFIYTGSVHISTEENAQELIEMADYLLLLHLKAFAGRVLLQMLNVSNCISMYYFAERYRCKELVSDIKKFIFVNFTTTAKTEQFLSLSSKRHFPLRTFSFIKSNSWDRVLSFDEDSREDFCVVCSDNYIYFIGGTAVRNGQKRILADVDRYDLISNTWDKIADIQEPRYGAYGAAGHGKIFIAGGSNGNIHLKNCEVYHEAANEWQFIGTLERWPTYLSDLLIVDSKLYLVDNSLYLCQQEKHGVIAYYDPDRNEWEKTTPIPLELIREPWIAYAYDAVCCPMRVYKECLDFFQHATTDEEAKNERGKEKPKCTVM